MFVQEVESTLKVFVAVIQGEERKYDVKLINSIVPPDLKNDPENVAATTRRNDMSKKRTKPDIGQHETRFRKGGRRNFICRPYSFKLIHMVLMWVFILKSNAQNTDIPNKSDIVFNITETKPIKIKIFIRKVFPPPKCAVFYQKEDITNKINSTVKIEGTLYSIEMGMTLHDCSGNLNISCLVDSRHFTTSVDIQQCCEGTECYPKHGFKFWTIVLIPVVMILFILVVWLCQKSRKNDTLQDPLQQNNLLDEF